MNRRTLLSASLLCAIGACANRPPPPPLKPNNFGRLGILYVIERPASGGIIPLARTANQLRSPQTTIYPPINPSMLGLAIGSAIRASRDAEYNAMSLEIHQVGFSPLPVLKDLIEKELAARDLRPTAITDSSVESQIRNESFNALPKEFDGIIDIQIYSIGYYDLGRGKGFAPYYSVIARVVDVMNPGEIAEEWAYSGTFEKTDEGTHDYWLEPALRQSDLTAFRTNAAYIREAFTRLLERTAKQIGEDLLKFTQSRQSSQSRVHGDGVAMSSCSLQRATLGRTSQDVPPWSTPCTAKTFLARSMPT